MRAIRCHAFTGPKDLRLEDIPDPVPGAGQVLIAVEACGLGFVDGLLVQGKYQVKDPLPFTPGGEMAGRVLAVGEGVSGDLVGLTPPGCAKSTDNPLSAARWSRSRVSIRPPHPSAGRARVPAR